MEKKTIGGFIAALRKANGLTQKQLAEKLNVSDKAVSRWERDETMPDLVLIPVLAEIFGVTADELLRGQRNNPDTTPSAAAPEKREQQLRRILKSNKSQYTTRSTISIGIALLGLLSAMIGNLAFLRAYIGFFAGCMFFGAAAVCQIIFLVHGLSAVDDEEFIGDQLSAYRQFLFKTGSGVFSCIILLFVFTLPLIIEVPDPYWGLAIGDWLICGVPLVLLGMVILTVANWILTWLLGKKGMIPVDPVKAARNLLRLKMVFGGAGILLVIFGCQALFNSLAKATDFVKGTEFKTAEAFIEYMETPTDYFGNPLTILGTEETDSNTIFYRFRDSNGEEFQIYCEMETVRPKLDDPESYFSYWKLNLYAESYAFNWKNDNSFTITVYNQDEHRNGDTIIESINLSFLLAYLSVIVVCVVLYRKKSRKI